MSAVDYEKIIEGSIQALQLGIDQGGINPYDIVKLMPEELVSQLEGAMYALSQERDHMTSQQESEHWVCLTGMRSIYT